MRLGSFGSAVVAALLAAGNFAVAATRPAFDAPPPGIVPTQAVLAAVLKRSASYGGVGDGRTRIEDWTVRSGGVSGTEHVVHEGDDRADTTHLGPFSYAFGKRHGQLWRQNENGLTILMDGLHERDDTSAEAVRDAAAGKADSTSGVSLLGESSLPAPSYVVEVKPKDGRH